MKYLPLILAGLLRKPLRSLLTSLSDPKNEMFALATDAADGLGVILGLIGGLLPATRAARTPISSRLRAR